MNNDIVKNIITHFDSKFETSTPSNKSTTSTSDVIVWLLAILTTGRAGTAYNVGSQEAISIADLAKLTSTLLGNSGYEVLGLQDSGWNPGRYVPSTQLIQDELGVKQTVSLAEAISRTAHWNDRRK